MKKVDKIQRTIEINTSIERAWNAITDPARLAKWFAPQCDFTLVVDSPMRLVWESGTVSRGVITLVESPTRFGFRWHAKPTPYSDPLTAENSTDVLFELKAIDNDRTQLVVTEAGFASLPDDAHEHILKENLAGWDAELAEFINFLTAEDLKS